MICEYDNRFYQQMVDESPICKPILKVMFDAWPIQRVIDVGCGIGHWLNACKQLGASSVVGVDGPWVPRDKMLLSEQEFSSVDLQDRSLPLYNLYPDPTFDLAICLETAEHLPHWIGSLLIETLCNLAPVVLFSAATPGQGGTDHINEKPLSYWVELFREHDYKLVDMIRPAIKDDDSIPIWYRNNIVVFIRETA